MTTTPATLSITFTLAEWRRASSGASCRYIPLHTGSWGGWVGNKLGVKCYASAAHRDRARLRQLDAWSHGLAPGVGCNVDVRIDGLSKPRHGYLTEHVLTREHGSSREHRARFARTNPDFAQLRKRLKAAGVRVADLRACNVGRDRADRLVCIDFDDITATGSSSR